MSFGNSQDEPLDSAHKKTYTCFSPNELQHIALGFFLHDVGMVLIPEQIINKTSTLNPNEFEVIKKHSYIKGAEIIEKNGLTTQPITR